MTAAASVGEAAVGVLEACDPDNKVALAFEVWAAWQRGDLSLDAEPPDLPARPGRPEKPILLSPRKMPKRSAGGQAGRIAMLHAVAHIEFTAINLAWDMVARFGAEVGDPKFIGDWARIGAEEARHFGMITDRLKDLGADYGDLPAHDGLWEAAEATSDHVLARLAIVPLVLEARGLDVSPQMVAKFRKAGDGTSADLLNAICRDEVGHVATGMYWLKQICAKLGQDPVSTYKDLVRARFKGGLKPPFNEAARAQAGLLPEFYEGL